MNAYEIARAEATRVVEAAYRKAVAAGELPEGTIPPVAVETPKDSSNGDWASTFAMQCAKPLHMAPRKIAEGIVANLELEGSIFDTVTIAGPGFMNFTLNQSWYEKAVRGVFEMGENYGRTKAAKPEKVMVEFVSANPTGPMHMGNARGGVLGDCLSSVLDWSGNDVTREFYINDAGNQVDKFAHSVEGRYIQEVKGEDAIEFDASWYQGDDIKALAHDLVEQYGDCLLEKTPEERRRAFGEMVQGEYSDVFQEMMQRAIDKATENIRQNPQVARLTQALANAYGVDTDDMDGLIEAVENGRVKDEKYYEDLAQQRGVSVKTARELDKMESDLKRSNTRNAQLQAMQQEATRQQRVSQIQAQWEAQAAQLKTQYPDFELQEVLANEQVADLMRRGVSLPDAYRAAYFDHIMQQATAQTAQKVEQGVAARIQQRAGRPGENGTRPGGAVTTHVDVASMSRRQLEDLERRARRGEKITL